MKPSRFFHDIYGPGLAYSGYAPSGADAWLPKNPALLLAITGNQIAVAGTMPILCAAGCASQAGLDLLGEAGFRLPRHLHIFHDQADYASQLAELAASGHRLVVQHRHPAATLAPAACWIAPERLSWLNDKGNLAELVAEDRRPRRFVHSPAAFPASRPGLPYPFLIKAATAQSTGGGALDIHICHAQADVEAALAKLGASERLVAEEWLPARRFLCLNYAVDAQAEVTYLGSTEIVNGQDGTSYQGNWLGGSAAAPPAAVELGRAIAERGIQAGYRGLLCIDMAELPDGRVLAYDLNFRACGSTVPLLVFDAVRQATGAPVAKFRSWSWQGGFRELIDAARHAWRQGYLVPLASFDPSPHDCASPARIAGLLLGTTRAEIAAREAGLARLGWL